MAENSDIAWTDHTFNPWVGCTKVSPACDHCYAEGWAKRAGHPELWAGERRRTSANNWQKPFKWNKDAKVAGVRRRVLCASLADVFDNQAQEEWRRNLWVLINATQDLDWLLLTKRPQNIVKMLPGKTANHPAWGDGWANVWLGTTVENQEEAARRIPHLLAAPALIRFVSVEPLLGPLDLERIIPRPGAETKTDALRGTVSDNLGPDGDGRVMWGSPRRTGKIDWAIFGGESGGNRREIDIEKHLRPAFEQCDAAGVKVFTKQDSAFKPGQRGRIPNDLWRQEWPA